MPLDYHITGRRSTPYGTTVHLRWHDGRGGVVRAELVKEAEALEARAKALRDEAKYVPDQIELPGGADSDDDVANAVKGRGEPIAKTLGLKE